MKKQLSREKNRARFLLLVVAGVLLFISVVTLFEEPRSIIVSVFFFLVAGLLIYLFSRTKKGKYNSFDKESLYYISGNTELKIPLKSISEINHSLLQSNNSTSKDIIYRSSSDKKQRIRLVITGYGSNFREFKRIIKKANPKAEV